MKNKEMQEICNKYKECKNCPLVIDDKIWQKNLITWCLKEFRRSQIERYQIALDKNNEVLAAKIMKEYQEIEKKTLERN